MVAGFCARTRRRFGVAANETGRQRHEADSAVTAFSAALAATPVLAQTKTIAIDGSSTVFPIAEAIAEEFQKSTKGARARDGRHFRHGRRI